MTDTDLEDVGDGDAPDTFDDRLADIERLIAALDNEADDRRRSLHRSVIVGLAARAGADALDRIAALLDRIGP